LDVQRQKFSSQEDRYLIDSAEEAYINGWFKGRGRGPATGNAFAEWIRKFLKDKGIEVEKGEVDLFEFGKFEVDAVIPNREDPKTILEMKIYVDKQHALMIGGLIDQLKNPEIKVGLVTLYEPGTSLKHNTVKLTDEAVPKILEKWKLVYEGKFDYFHIEKVHSGFGWSRELERLLKFCQISNK
jgi:hypothetical protein